MTVCQVCGAKSPNGFLCNACVDRLETAVAELPADLRDLELVASRQARGPLGLGDNRLGVQWDGPFEEGSLGDAPWEFAPGAADQLWAAANTITTWIRHLCESRRTVPPTATRGTYETVRLLRIDRNRMHIDTPRVFIPSPEQPLGPMVEWLLTNIEAIRQDEAAAVIYDELIGLHQENDRWILGRSHIEEFAGRCDATQVSFELVGTTLMPIAAICGTALYGRQDEEHVRCQSCGMRYPLADRLAEMRDRQINEQLARAHTIANALTTIDEPVSPTLLRKWIQRDAKADPAPEGPTCITCTHRTCMLIRRPPILEQGRDEDGHALYRVGDVRTRLRLVQEQRGAKLSA